MHAACMQREHGGSSALARYGTQINKQCSTDQVTAREAAEAESGLALALVGKMGGSLGAQAMTW